MKAWGSWKGEGFARLQGVAASAVAVAAGICQCLQWLHLYGGGDGGEVVGGGVFLPAEEVGGVGGLPSGGGDGLRAAVGADGGAGVVGVAVADFGGRAVCCRRRPYGHGHEYGDGGSYFGEAGFRGGCAGGSVGACLPSSFSGHGRLLFHACGDAAYLYGLAYEGGCGFTVGTGQGGGVGADVVCAGAGRQQGKQQGGEQ